MPWSLMEDQIYNGDLYHYRGENGYNGILNLPAKFNYPPNCICLQFRRIDCVSTNDSDERKHISCAIKSIANKLHDEGKIDKLTVDSINEFNPSNKSVYTIITDKQSEDFNNNVVKCDFKVCDYYIACFSTDPKNGHIMQEFKANHVFVFGNGFSYGDSSDVGSWDNSAFKARFTISAFYPFKALRESFLNFQIRRVLYNEEEMRSLLEPEIMEIQELINKTGKDDVKIEEKIEDIYALYDAFFKEPRYAEEREVRFAIKVPHKFNKKILEANYFRFVDWKEENEKMYLPVDKEMFLKEFR